MAMSLNRVQLIGNLTRDPEIRQIPGGQSVATLSIATNFSWVDQSGQKQDKAEYHNVVAWRKLADICGQYLRKGSKIFVEGRLQTRDWEGEDGVKRYKTEIVADNMIMLDRKGEGMSGEQSFAGGLNRKSEVMADSQPVEVTDDVSIDDLPF
jgi:single-strand DNA-binding protein